MGASDTALKITIVLTEQLFDELRSVATGRLETAGVLLASIAHEDAATLRLLARQIEWVPDVHYSRREADGLSVASEGYIPALQLAETQGVMPIWLHTHPGIGSSPMPSHHDHRVDTQIADLFRLRSGAPYYGALIVSPTVTGIQFTGHIEQEGAPPIEMDRMWIVGDRFRLLRALTSEVVDVPLEFDRNVRAFGGAIQEVLANLRVAIVGCGGTGSAVAEQLVRLGVRDLVAIDPDKVSGSNVTRVYGSTPKDVGSAKVEVLRQHLTRIAPDAQVEAVPSMLTTETAARRLATCDVVFGCTDDNAGRLVLSRVATYLMTPTIDCGVLLTTDQDGLLVGIDGRVTIVAPGMACLVCRGRIDVARAATELLTPTERTRRIDEGYAPALPGIEPAVVTYTTLVAATAVSELLERLIGYGPIPRPSEILLRCHEREISTNTAAPKKRHYCHADSGKIGLSTAKPFLEQAWPD